MASRAGRDVLSAIVIGLLCVPTMATAAPPSDGLILWLAADDVDADGDATNSPPGGTPVAQWNDKSELGNHVKQDAAERQPTLQTDGPGGRAAVRFHGDDLLELAGCRGLESGDQQFHILVVIRAPAGSAHQSQRIVDLNSRDRGAEAFPGRTGFWLGYQQGRGKPRLGIQNGDEGEGQRTAWNGQANLIEAVYSGEQKFALHLNGRREQRALFNGTHFLGFKQDVTLALGQQFGMQTSTATFYEGDIAEVLIYNRNLTATERHEIGMSLAEKYALDTEYRPIPDFDEQIQPILAQYCHDCHGADTQEADLDLRSVASMLHGGQAGPVIVRGFPDRSELMSLIEAGKMPPEDEPRPGVAEIGLLRDWIEADAPSNESPVTVADVSSITAEQRQHWAYQKLQHIEPPQVSHIGRTRNVIDRFVLARLEEQGLTFSEETDRASLARRAYFDLHGLPPSPEAIDAFLEDDAPQAYERLVDRLLREPHFGERWGRYWLDVAGYVGVYGSDNDAAIIKPLEGKWRYRDYVIRSLNNDKPFDQFIVEQLAGDELYAWRSAEEFTPQIREALIATGFLLCANDDTDQNELNTPDTRHHVLQRTTEVVVSNLLALTLQCAKCHDHKYEAIPQEDYYRMLAVFAPAFNVHNWTVSTGHSRADVADARRRNIDETNAATAAGIEASKQRNQEVRDRYRREVFERKLAALPETMRDSIRQAVQRPAQERSNEQKRLAAKYESALAVSADELQAAMQDEDRVALAEAASEIARLEASRSHYGTIQAVCESIPPPRTHVLRRGNYLRPGLEVQPALLGILQLPEEGTGASSNDSADAHSSSGRRLALARELTDANRLAGQYVARVIVNRLWQQVFGTGIVETTDNFGVSGATPSHPELLDWLTSEFLRNGWRIKPVVKLMLTSTTYRQTSRLTEQAKRAEQVDPANRLLWRMNLRRLDSEHVRDAMLSASGRLDRSLYGTFVPLHVRPDGVVVIKQEGLPTPTYQWRRSVYVLARRNYHLTMLDVFDQPVVARNCTVRRPSAVVSQSLTLLHDDFVIECANDFARRVIASAGSRDPSVLIRAAFRIALGREPDTEEVGWCSELIDRQIEHSRSAEGPSDDAQVAALAQLCKMLFNTSEFLYVQ